MNTLNKNNLNISYLNSEDSKLIDDILMSSEVNYSIDQLMEIAGLSVAIAINNEIEKEKDEWGNIKRILNISGPGNNGGDGLVAARYLKEFGYSVDILYPKKTEKELYQKLLNQCERYSIKIVGNDVIESLNDYDLIIDSIFGFSFKGEIRQPFDKIIKAIKDCKAKIVSVDVPSGWDVEKGNINDSFTPHMLVSLTLPKLCSKDYKGIHYLGGRFIPDFLFEKMKLKKPVYKGADMVMLL